MKHVKWPRPVANYKNKTWKWCKEKGFLRELCYLFSLYSRLRNSHRCRPVTPKNSTLSLSLLFCSCQLRFTACFNPTTSSPLPALCLSLKTSIGPEKSVWRRRRRWRHKHCQRVIKIRLGHHLLLTSHVMPCKFITSNYAWCTSICASLDIWKKDCWWERMEEEEEMEMEKGKVCATERIGDDDE